MVFLLINQHKSKRFMLIFFGFSYIVLKRKVTNLIVLVQLLDIVLVLQHEQVKKIVSDTRQAGCFS